MIKLRLESSWDEMIEMLLEAAPQLRPEEIDFIEGEDEELVRTLSQRLNRSYEQITGWVESLSSSSAVRSI